MNLKNLLIVTLLFMFSSTIAQIDYLSPPERIDKGINYFKEGNYAKAQDIFRGFNVNDSFYVKSGEFLYASHVALKEWDEAFNVASNFAGDLTVDSRDNFYANAGKAAFHGGIHQKGIDVLNKGVKTFSKDPDLYDYLGKNYFMLRQDSMAYDATLKGLKLNPFHAGLLENLGELNAYNENYTQASMAYYVALFVHYHHSRKFYDKEKTGVLMQKFQITLGAKFDQDLFPFNWDGDSDTKSDYEDKKNANPLTNFEISNYFPEVDELLEAKIALNSRYKSRAKIDYKFAKQSQLMTDKLSEVFKPKKVNKDYFVYGEILQPFLVEFREDKNLLFYFQGSIAAIFDGKYFNKIQKKYEKKSVPKNRQLTKIMSQVMYKIPRTYDGEVQKVNRRFSAYSMQLYALGNLSDASGTDEVSNRKGYWEYLYNNGELETSGEYREGKKDGAWVEYNKAGVKTYRYEYDDGKIEKFQEFEENGKLVLERNISNGSLIDSLIVKYPDGAWKRILHMPNGEKSEGTITEFHANGRVMYSADIKNFEFISGFIQSDKRGNKVYEANYKNGEQDGEVKSYFSSGKLYMIGKYDNGEKTGVWQYFNRDGTQTSRINYDKDELDGKQEYFYADGTPKSVVFYKSGDKDGECLYYNEEGNLRLKEKYDEGVLTYIEGFDKNEKSIYREKLGSSTQLVMKHPNGSKRAEGKMKDGKKTGEWKYYDKHGNLEEVSEYKDGKTEGKVMIYYASGLKKREYFTKSGDYDGKYLSYFPNGKKRSEGFYKKDEKQGEWVYFYPDGKLSRKLFFRDGETYGFQYYYDVKGKLNNNTYFKNDWSYYRVSYDSTERPIDTLFYVNPIAETYYTLNVLGDTTFISGLKANRLHGKGVFEPKNSFAYEAEYDNGNIHGTITINDELGNLKAKKVYHYGDLVTFEGYNGQFGKLTYKGEYKHGSLSGLDYSYFPNGDIRIISNQIAGQREGIEQRFSADGSLALVIKWQNGEMISYGIDSNNLKPINDGVQVISLKYSNGKKAAEVTVKNGDFEGEYKLYNKNGSLGVLINYKYGYLNGLYQLNDAKGKPQKEVQYLLGDFHGFYKVYSTSGKLIYELNYLNDDKHGFSHYYKNGLLYKSYYYYNDELLYEK